MISRAGAAAAPAAEKSQTPTAERDSVPISKGGGVSTSFLQQPTEGVVQFHISVKVDMNQFSGWRPDRIASFFAGIAQVLAAKGDIEREASKD